jgi:hypothetical protein
MWEAWLCVDTEVFPGFAIKLAWGLVSGASTRGKYPCLWGYRNVTVFLETLVLEGNLNFKTQYHAREAAS